AKTGSSPHLSVSPSLPLSVSPSLHLRPNPIDAFVRARLSELGLEPSPPADKPRWLRRVSLDLVGLPPTPAELDAFTTDVSDRAYERVVDRLLASPHYGERWARPWLDLARYADSHGFQKDDLRDIWPYRDWVIRAMNADMPFDQFTIWQIAGDLLPETRNPKLRTQNLDPLTATGFHRSVPTNVENGTDQEEGRVNQVFDRVNTTAAVWLGSTLECAQCHNHKYDPFSQKEYYQLFACFNNTPRETDFATAKSRAALKFIGPYLELPDPENEAKRTSLQARMKQLDDQIEAHTQLALARLPEWERTAAAALATAGQIHPLDILNFDSTAGSAYKTLPDKSVLLVEETPDRDTYIITVATNLTAIRGFKVEALSDPSLPGNGPGRAGAEQPNFILNNFRVAISSGNGTPTPVKLVQASASFSQATFPVASLLDPANANRSGWGISPQFHREHWAIFATEKPLGDPAGATLTFTLEQNSGTRQTIGRLRLSALTGATGGRLMPAEIVAILRTPPASRTSAQARRLNDHFLAEDKALEGLKRVKLEIAAQLKAAKPPQTLVMQELAAPRATAVMNRGNFLDPGEPVQPGTPAVLHAMPEKWSYGALAAESEQNAAGTPRPQERPTRLDLARWLLDPENPLVARVTVNRWWPSSSAAASSAWTRCGPATPAA
ncbi:MAG: DUF1549 domain-containing protein, partial [Opitutaceae bacterium]